MQAAPSEELSARTLEAMLGALFLAEGGGLFSAWQLWRWLQRPEPSSGLNESPDPVMGHYAFGSFQNFLGRTPSYTELQEVEQIFAIEKRLASAVGCELDKDDKSPICIALRGFDKR